MHFQYELQGRYISIGDPLDTKKAIDSNVVYSPAELSKIHVSCKSVNPIDKVTDVLVENVDCLELAIQLKAMGLNPLVLNMASHKRPGGGKNSFKFQKNLKKFHQIY